MNTLQGNLRKEWRDHRTTIAVLTLMSMALVSLAVFLVPSRWATGSDMPAFCAAGVLVAFIMLSGGEVLSQETSGTRQRFLARLPQGLNGCFRAKLIFYVALLVAAALLGWSLAIVAILCRTGDIIDVGPLGWNGHMEMAFVALGPALILASLTFGVSTWVPRGAAAAPAAVVLLGAALSPILVLWIRHGYTPTGDGLGWLFLFLLGAGPVLAWLSFTRWRRFERPAWRAALPGLGLAAAAFVPMWIDCGNRFRVLADDSPGAEGVTILRAVLCEDRRHVIALTSRELSWTKPDDRTYRVRVIDLETGEWNQPVEGRAGLLINDRTAVIYGRDEARRGPEVVLDLADGSRTSLIPRKRSQDTKISRRPQRFDERSRSIFDWYRDERVPRKFLPTQMPSEADVFTIESRWLVRATGDASTTSQAVWSLYDPDSEVWTTLPWPQTSDTDYHFLFRGGFLFLRDKERLFRASITDGSLSEVAMPPGVRPYYLSPPSSFQPYGFSFEEDLVCLSGGYSGFDRLIYDDSELSLRKMEGQRWANWGPIGFTTDGGLLAVAFADSCIVRRDLLTGEDVVVFPRRD